jgi:hypothetical protein
MSKNGVDSQNPPIQKTKPSSNENKTIIWDRPQRILRRVYPFLFYSIDNKTLFYIYSIQSTIRKGVPIMRLRRISF